MFKEVIEELLEQERTKSVPLSHEFTPLAPQPLKACFVDGGNACIFDSPGVRIEYVRIAGVIYGVADAQGVNGARVKRWATKRLEGAVIIRNDGKQITATAEKPLDFSLTLPVDDEQLTLGREEVSLATVASLTRFLLECRLLCSLGEEHDCRLLVRDGSLVGKNAYEEWELTRLFKSGKLVAGLSKTNTLLLRDGTAATARLLEDGPDGAWQSPFGREGSIRISLVKLHPRANHAFRLDTLGEEERVAAALAAVSGDAAFPGYPYPLIEADRLARIPNRELALLQTRFKAEAGPDWRRLERMARGKDAHGVLDRL